MLGRRRQAGSLSEKSALERQQDAIDELAHLMERYADRLPFEAGDFAKRYLDGRLKVGVKLRSRRDRKDFHFIVSRRGLEHESPVRGERRHLSGVRLAEVVVR